MKRIVPIFIIILLLNGCSATTQPKWLYKLKNDGIYRIEQNTNAITKINGENYASNFMITDEWVYFSDNKKLYRMDNQNRKEILDYDDCWCLSMNVDWLYYIKENRIFKMKPDGSEKQQLLENKVNWMVVSEKYIFYALNVPIDTKNHFDDGPRLPMGQLHRVDLSGKNNINLKVLATELRLYNNNVYYTDDNDNYLYSMNPETFSRTILYRGHFIEDIYFSEGYVFFILDRNLYRMSIVQGTLTQLTYGYWNSCHGILDGYVYGYNDNDGLYRFKINGSNMEKVDEPYKYG